MGDHANRSDRAPAAGCTAHPLAHAGLALALLAQPAPAAAQTVVPATPPPPPMEDRARAVECLSLAIAYEAGREPEEGQQAVAEVVLNRVGMPRYPKSVCGVVFQGSSRSTGCQFTFTCDGSLRRRLPDAMLERARAIAELAIDGRLPPRTGGASNYHADYVTPYWAAALTRVTKIGAHIFYRAPDGVAPPGALSPAGGAAPAGAAAPQHPASPPPAPAPFLPWGLSPHVAR